MRALGLCGVAAEAAEAVAAGATGEEAGALTPEMLKSGAWKTLQFRRYNIDVPPSRIDSPRMKRPVSIMNTGVKARKGRESESGESLRARM